MKKQLHFLSLLALAFLVSANLSAQTTIIEDDFEDPDFYEFAIGDWDTEAVAGEGVAGSIGIQMGGDPVAGCGIWSNGSVGTSVVGNTYKLSVWIKSMGAEGDAVAPVVLQVKPIISSPNAECVGPDWPANGWQQATLLNITTEWQEQVAYVTAEMVGDLWITLWSFSGYGHWNNNEGIGGQTCTGNTGWGLSEVDALAVIDDFKMEDMGADFVIPSYTVTFLYSDGVTIATEVVTHGEAATAPDGFESDTPATVWASVTSDLTITGNDPSAVGDLATVKAAIYIANDELQNVNGEVKVYDISGRVMLQENAAAGTLNVASLKNGIYIVHANNASVKVVKMK